MERVIEPSTVELDRLRYRRLFPWIHLTRAFRIALDFRKLLLGGLALLLLSLGQQAIVHLPIGPPDGMPNVSAVEFTPTIPVTGLGNPATWFTSWPILVSPLQSIWKPAAMLLQPELTWTEAIVALALLLWAVLVWSFFATMITRMAAVQFARDEKISLNQAARFAIARFLQVFSSPLLPIGFIFGFWILLFCGGIIGRIPAVGPVLVGVFWGIALVCGLAMTLLLIGLAVGWPIMIATVSTQGTDGFDGFSRSFDYVFSRPIHFAWFTVVSIGLGVLSLALVSVGALLILYLASWPITRGMGGSDLVTWNTIFELFTSKGFPSPQYPAVMALTIWLRAFGLLVAGFVPSYFWTSSTIMFFLLRQSTDANELTEVWMPLDDEDDENLIRLAGVAATDHPVSERPVHPEGSSTPDPGENNE
ncbi:hypothetical protein [Thalassoroseus pseudoceratinae]|uniref:hypothetical protein n=1 Tax=Thalassoroseus pseudoceratinae TaxID=2713176 RepID=UPI001424107E|nr:hypothetical protein [Thalassoroseus pseudoceratinae]